MTRIYQPFAWIIYLSGILMALAFAAQRVVSMYQIWFYSLPRANTAGGGKLPSVARQSVYNKVESVARLYGHAYQLAVSWS